LKVVRIKKDEKENEEKMGKKRKKEREVQNEEKVKTKFRKIM
jgi:hypothetical protein